MLFFIGLIVVFVMVFGGFLIAGGKMDVILHAAPHELITILGGAVGAFIIANSIGIIKGSGTGLMMVIKGPKWKKSDYVELLCLLFVLIKTLRSKGVVALEAHVETPEESKIFNHFSSISKDHHLVEFVCDYMRMMTMNFDDPHQFEDAMDQELERIHEEEHEPQHALTTMSDGLPALGIVAAVLGVIKTMGSINAPVEILGNMVAGALVGTFLGIFLAYGIVGPIANRLGQVLAEDSRTFAVIKAILISHLHGNAPQISVEIGRKRVPGPLMPGFLELEEIIGELPPDL